MNKKIEDEVVGVFDCDDTLYISLKPEDRDATLEKLREKFLRDIDRSDLISIWKKEGGTYFDLFLEKYIGREARYRYYAQVWGKEMPLPKFGEYEKEIKEVVEYLTKQNKVKIVVWSMSPTIWVRRILLNFGYSLEKIVVFGCDNLKKQKGEKGYFDYFLKEIRKRLPERKFVLVMVGNSDLDFPDKGAEKYDYIKEVWRIGINYRGFREDVIRVRSPIELLKYFATKAAFSYKEPLKIGKQRA